MNYVINIDLKPRLGVYDYDCIYCILSTHFYVHVSIISIISSLLKKYFKTRLAAPATSGQPTFPVAIYGCFSGAFHSSSHLLLRTSLSIVNLYMYYLVL